MLSCAYFDIKIGCRLGKRQVQVVPHAKIGLVPRFAAARVRLRLHAVDHDVSALS